MNLCFVQCSNVLITPLSVFPVPPKVHQIDGTPLLYDGEHLLLTCIVTGIPPPSIDWLHDRLDWFLKYLKKSCLVFGAS